MTDPDQWNVPTVEEIEEARAERGINVSHFSLAIGYQSSNAWHLVLKQGTRPNIERMDKAVKALQYYDEHGIIPMPGEV